MAYKKSGTTKDIKHNVIAVWRSDPSEDGASKSELMTESWIINGRETAPKIARREFYQTKDGQWKSGKAKGLSQADFWLILEKAREIAPTIGMPASNIDKIFGEHQVTEVAPF